MTVQFAAQFLDTYFAPSISSFNAAEIPDIANEIKESQHWLANHFLNSLFRGHYNEEWRQRAIVFLFRAQNSVRHYQLAREVTFSFLQKSISGRPFTGAYFDALDHWESVISNLHLAVDLLEEAKLPDFDSGEDGLRLRLMVNRIKHVAEDVGKVAHASLTVPMWMTNEGLETRAAKMSYVEIADNVRELAKAADIMANPASNADSQTSSTSRP